jgi:catechol 2,3-dioxygenase-like lactoylglutathione lyase family enzyme
MARAKGIGGVFFKSHDPDKVKAWYHEHLGLEPREEAGGAVLLRWRDVEEDGQEQVTVWSPFPLQTDYFDPTTSSYMINYIVDDLDEVLQHLRAAGVQVDDRVVEDDYGRFGWAVDPEGVRFELWQPPAR